MARGTLTNQIAETLRRRIADGEFGSEVGAKLPSETELEELFPEAGRGTIRRALSVLVHEGLLTSHAGRGYFVRSYEQLDWMPGTFEHATARRDTTEAGADAWSADVIAQGRTPRQEVDVSIIVPPALVAGRLATPVGEMVVMRRRLRFVDETPYQTATSYYPRYVAENSPIMQPGDVVIPGGLMTAAGYQQYRFRDEIVVRWARPDEAARLELPPVTPIAEHVRTGYAEDGRPVRVIVTIVPGDRHRIIYEVGAA